MPLLKDRYLTRSGTSLLTPEQAAEKIVENGSLEPHFKVECCWDSLEYQLVFGDKVVSNEFEDVVDPPDLTHTEDDLNKLLDIIEASPRFSTKYLSRIETELQFFEKTLNVKFLLRLHRMICEFKEENVVWGVGRGSAVASYILYLLEVHDINPCEYGIPFHEMSKEQ